MTPRGLLKKIKRLENIAIISFFPSKQGTEMSEYNEDWSKRTDRYEINLINQFQKEVILDTLKDVRIGFDIQSDLSTHTHGYRRLCEKIERLTKK